MGADDRRHAAAGIRGLSGRFEKGRSGNPSGRPKARRPHVSAFDIIFDKTLTVTQGGVERELTVDEALQLQTYQAALKGSRPAVRAVLKMIEKREVALRKKAPTVAPTRNPMRVKYDADNANDAMLLLSLVSIDETQTGYFKERPKIETWAAQAALSRPGRPKANRPRPEDIKAIVHDPHKLRLNGGVPR